MTSCFLFSFIPKSFAFIIPGGVAFTSFSHQRATRCAIKKRVRFGLRTAAVTHLLAREKNEHRIGSALCMLPGNNRNDNNNLQQLLPTIATFVGLTLFFFSPLGGIFFAITNSLFVLALLTPLIFFGGFQLWSKLNTIQGNCPSCGAPVVVMKNGNDSADNLFLFSGSSTPCLNCGAFVRATADQKGIELCNPPPTSDYFSSNSIADFFTVTETMSDGDESKARRERTIIDVTAQDE